MVYYFVKTTLEHRHINLDLATCDYHFFKCCSEGFEVTDLKMISRKITFVTSWMMTQVTDFIKTCYKRSPHDVMKALFLTGSMF